MRSRGTQEIRKTKHILSEKRNRMRGACTTCRATFVNGSRIGTPLIITAAAQSPILLDPHKASAAAEARVVMAAAVVVPAVDFAAVIEVALMVHLHRHLKISKTVSHPHLLPTVFLRAVGDVVDLAVVVEGRADRAFQVDPMAAGGLEAAAVCRADSA